MLNLVHGLAFGKRKFYIATYSKITADLSICDNCDVKSGLNLLFLHQNESGLAKPFR